MRTAVSLSVLMVVLAGCTTDTTDTTPANQAPSVGATQRAGQAEITLLAVVDPAPVDKIKPKRGTRLVAARFQVHNTGGEDYPVAERDVHFGVGGNRFSTSALAMSAGTMLNAVTLGPGQSAVGYVTAELPEGQPVATVAYQSDHEEAWWRVEGQTVRTPPPAPPARPTPHAHRLGEAVTISEGSRLTIKATGLSDAETPQPDAAAKPGQRVVQVSFTVKNLGGPITEDPLSRTMVLYNAAAEPVVAYPFRHSPPTPMYEPLPVGRQVTWPVQFALPAGFVPDHVSFTPEFGRRSTTVWALR